MIRSQNARQRQFDAAPIVSVIMANYRGGEHLGAAIRSVLAQTVGNIEVIVSDDASPDDSVAIVQDLMRTDARLCLVATQSNAGPAAARNRALDEARGEWVAIVDSDDIIHPERLEILLATASALGADGVADDLLFFSTTDRSVGGTLLGDFAGTSPWNLDAELLAKETTAGGRTPPFGYLKPLVRRSKIADLRYDSGLRIGEDFDFLLRLLLSGCSFFVTPQPLYLYRRHSASISHRLSAEAVNAMIDSLAQLSGREAEANPPVAQAIERRISQLRRVSAYDDLVRAAKDRSVVRAASLICRDPSLLGPLWRSFFEHVAARIRRRRTVPEFARTMLFMTEGAPAGAVPPNPMMANARVAETIRVPPYTGTEDRLTIDPETRRLWQRITHLGCANDIAAVGFGLAGLHAMSFIPSPAEATVVIDDPDEIGQAMAWTTAVQTRLLVTEQALSSVTPYPDVRRLPEGLFEVVRGSPQSADSPDVSDALFAGSGRMSGDPGEVAAGLSSAG